MRPAANAARCHAELSRIGLGVADELGNRLCGKRWVHHQNIGHPHDARDRCGVAEKIETEFVVERRVDGGRRPGGKQRIAVRGRTHDHLGRQVGAGAGPVLDDDGLAEMLRQPLPDQARDDVVWAAGGGRNDNAHRPRWKCLCPRAPRHHRERGSTRRQLQKSAAWKHHGIHSAVRALARACNPTELRAANKLRPFHEAPEGIMSPPKEIR
jgi:hypothetical protein